jgi:hypothetical protein
MLNKQEEMLNAIFQNAVRFLNISVDEIINSDFNDINNIVKTSVLIQMTVELSLKYAVAYNMGDISIKKILEIRYQNQLIDDIYDEFLKNTLRVVSFENLKNYIRTLSIFKFNKNEEIEMIEKFQKIRNRLLHFSYNFDPKETSNIKETYIYIVFKIIFPLLYEGYSEESINYLTPSEFIKIYVSEEKYKKIRSMNEYKKIMLHIVNVLKNKGEVTIGKCIHCNEISWIKEIGKCIICESNNGDDVLLRCPVCNENKSVIYQSLNMGINNNAATGICISCGMKMSVIKCKKCGRYNVYEDDIAFLCAIEHLEESVCDIDCINIMKKNKMPYEYAYVIPAIIFSECLNINEISVLNKNKNCIRILGKKTQDKYILHNNIDDAVMEGILYLVDKKCILLHISENQILKRINKLIEDEYICGSLEEIQALYRKLFNSIHSEEISLRFSEVLQSLIGRKFEGVNSDEYSVLYECRDYLTIDDKIFFGVYTNDKLIKPSEIK